MGRLAALVLALAPTFAFAAPARLGEPVELTEVEPTAAERKRQAAVVAIAQRWLSNRDFAHAVVDDALLRIDRPGDRPQWIDLATLVAATHAVEYRAEWAPQVGRVLTAATETWPTVRDALHGRPFDALKDDLRLAVLSRARDGGPDPVVSQTLAPRLHVGLALMVGDSLQWVRRSAVEAWGLGDNELLRHAADRTARKASLTRWVHEQWPRYERYDGVDRLAGSSMVALAPLLAEGVPCGVVVGTIDRRAFGVQLMVEPEDLQGGVRVVEQALAGVSWLTRKIEWGLYWVRGDAWVPYVVTVTNELRIVRPPRELTRCLAERTSR